MDLKKKAQLHIYLPTTIHLPEFEDVTIHALVDIGAEASLLQQVFIPKQFWLPLDTKTSLTDFMGRQVPVTHKVANIAVSIPNIHNNLTTYKFNFALLPLDFNTDCLIGLDNLRHFFSFQHSLLYF
ncbi:hypothetical protein HPP92_005542 [Vanilla planifolia]|uniref:Peptidase A2 domain-containing protein n=1 Tax=Vanilla planifolia TaxID=51239 RepID=A0A835RPW5_VANPL|nr:hypothetical protein HPP92_005542 [Vanilla planifolia]